MEPWREELYHHGILGMKWGVRNGPPYPLDEKDHSASEKKSRLRKSLEEAPEKQHKGRDKRPSKNTARNESSEDIKDILNPYRSPKAYGKMKIQQVEAYAKRAGFLTGLGLTWGGIDGVKEAGKIVASDLLSKIGISPVSSVEDDLEKLMDDVIRNANR